MRMRPRLAPKGCHDAPMRGPKLLRSSGKTLVAPVVPKAASSASVGLLGEREEFVLVAQAGVDGEGGLEAPVVLKEAGPLLRVEDGGLLAEALGEGAEAEVVDGRDDGGAAAVGVGVDAEGVVGDPVDEASGVACGGVAVVVEGTLGVGEGVDVVVDEADVDAGLDLMAAVGPGEEVG